MTPSSCFLYLPIAVFESVDKATEDVGKATKEVDKADKGTEDADTGTEDQNIEGIVTPHQGPDHFAHTYVTRFRMH